MQAKKRIESIFSFETIKEMLVKTLDIEINYELYRVKLFEKVAPEAKKMNFYLKTIPMNTKIALHKKNTEVKFEARCPFKSTTKEAFDDESPGAPFSNDEAIFQISLKKSSETLIFDVFSDTSQLYIRNIVISESGKLHTGRHFSDFHPDTQEQFTKYLSTRLPIEDLSNFVDRFSIERQDDLYIEWLKKIHKCLKS